MGSTPNAADYYSRPDPTLQIMQLQTQRALGQQQLENEGRLLGYAANMPMESWTPDTWGQDGMAAQSAQIAAINQFKNRQLEEQTNPALAKLRRELPGKMEEELSGNSWENQMKEWAKTTGLERYLGSGLGDSTIGRSALFDDATREGAAIRQAKLQQASAYLAGNPVVDAGINAGSAIGAQQAAQIQGLQQRAGFRDTMLGRTQNASQSTTDWLNQIMSSSNQAVESNKRDWQNYQQAMYKSAQDKAAAKNAMIGSAISAVGTVAGAAVGGPMGAAMGSQLGKLAGGGGGGGGSDPGYQGMEDGMRVYSRPGSYRIG
jgi:hypothetical protein